MRDKNLKYTSLFKEFITIFAAALLFTAIFSLVALYYNQSRFHYKDTAEDLRKINRYLVKEFEKDGADFSELTKWFKKHQEELCIPFDYPDHSDGYEKIFLNAFAERYPGKVFGKDIDFTGLDDEIKLLYARYKYLYWLNVLDDTKEAYGLDYVYFIYPEEDEDHVMCYMFDGAKEEVTINGQSCLVVGFDAYQDPKIHKYMWKAWEEKKDPKGMDELDNEYGNVYSHSSPVIYNGELIGLVTTESNVGYVKALVLHNVSRLGMLIGIVLIACMLLLMLFVKKAVLNRIFKLEGFIKEYSQNKNVAIASEIRSQISVMDELGNLSNGFADMIDELKLHMDHLEQVTAEREKISAELSIATTIQASMLPRIFPAFPDRKEFDLYASMDPAKEVGGDFYDFFYTDDMHLAMVIADVSGKGVPAALFMAISKALIKDRAQEVCDPAEALCNVNNMLCEYNDAELFVTVWLGILDIESGDIAFADAGHEYPVMVHDDGSYELVKAARKKPPVASIEGIKYQTNHIKMNPGDVLFLYTDGVPEATNSANELYGMDRLVSVLPENKDEDVVEILKAIRKDVDDFVKDAPQFDDLTMLAIRLNK